MCVCVCVCAHVSACVCFCVRLRVSAWQAVRVRACACVCKLLIRKFWKVRCANLLNILESCIVSRCFQDGGDVGVRVRACAYGKRSE